VETLAYLDPGSGGLIVQIIAGGLAGLTTVFVLFRRRLAAMFKTGRRKEPEDHAAQEKR